MRPSHPSAQDRSMAEPMLLAALDHIYSHGTGNERQLAKLCADLIRLAGGSSTVKDYIDRKAVETLDEGERPWA